MSTFNNLEESLAHEKLGKVSVQVDYIIVQSNNIRRAGVYEWVCSVYVRSHCKL